VKRTPVAPLAILALGLVMALPAMAQKYVFPGKEIPAPCVDCLGKNAAGIPNKDLPTWPYADPFVRHVGRYVDSTTTGNVQNLGIRTVRAGMIRVSPATNRVYIALGEAVGGYSLDSLFDTTLALPLIDVGDLPLAKRPTGRSPLEMVAPPQSLFYAESALSGWFWQILDAQRVLTDFDADDRGLVYVGTYDFGWGIERDTPAVSMMPMQFVQQVQNTPHAVNTVFSLKVGDKYYAVVSQNVASAGKHTIYDVTQVPVAGGLPVVASRPVVKTRRPVWNPIWPRTSSGIVAWAKYDATERLAILDTAGHVRIFDYWSFVHGFGPRADYAPSSTAKAFADMAFDESGTLWIAEGPTIRNSAQPTQNVLYRVSANGSGYTKDTVDVYGGAFAPQKISAGGGYVVVAGKAPDQKNVLTGDLRLINVAGATPRLMSTGDFIRRYYHAAPATYADPGIYVDNWAVQLIRRNGTTYLLYSAGGLGDVFELQSPN
jgi:hypothetical protein